MKNAEINSTLFCFIRYSLFGCCCFIGYSLFGCCNVPDYGQLIVCKGFGWAYNGHINFIKLKRE